MRKVILAVLGDASHNLYQLRFDAGNAVANGMSPETALKAVTSNVAEVFGINAGEIKPGKLADLAILDANPLEDIENTQHVAMVMINGRLYDAKTMNEIGNREKERAPFWWEQEKYNQAFPWHQETHSFLNGGCTCHTKH